MVEVSARDHEMAERFMSDAPGEGFEFGFPFGAYGDAIHGERVLAVELPILLALAREEGRRGIGLPKARRKG